MGIATIALEDIIIPDDFQNSVPKQYKINRVKKYFNKYHTIDKPIVLSPDGILMDGYVRYLVAKKEGMKSIPYIQGNLDLKEDQCDMLSYISRQYIIGRFDNGSKYIWKLRKNINVNIGDKVIVANKNGRAVVTVDSVFESTDRTMLKHKPVLKVKHIKMLN